MRRSFLKRSDMIPLSIGAAGCATPGRGYIRALQRLLCLFVLHSACCLQVWGQGTAFSYQGRLNDGANPANGNYDFEFILFDTNQFGFPAAPILTNTNVSVVNGLFTTTLDFGAGVFSGTNFWLGISVRTNGGGTFTDLSPRQPVTPTPYAITAENLAGVLENDVIQSGASLATISGGAGNVIQTGANFAAIGGGGANAIQAGADHSTIAGGSGNGIETGAFESFVGGGQQNFIYAVWSAIGGGLDNLIQTNANYSFIGGGQNNQILMGANNSTISGGLQNQIGIVSQYATIGGGYVNIIHTNSVYAAISGGFDNVIQDNSYAAMIGGGRQNQILVGAFDSTISGGFENVVESDESIIGGGIQNDIHAGSIYSTVGGGADNVVQTSAGDAVIAGGFRNLIQSNASDSTISGGNGNFIGPFEVGAVIGGGVDNSNISYIGTIGGGFLNAANGSYATVSGGFENAASTYATVPGGYSNLASGVYSFAAGTQAQAVHLGTFIWADSQGTPYSSDRNNQFKIRAGGGVQMDVSGSAGLNPAAVTISSTSGSGVGLYVAQASSDSTLVLGNDGTGDFIKSFHNGNVVFEVLNDGTVKSKGVVLTSDRGAKENFAPLDTRTVLAKVISLPVTEWNYKDDAADQKHIGPVAQDFHAAFGLNGADDKRISVVDEGGVALAAIQGLNEKVEGRSQEEKNQIESLKAENAELKARLEKLEQFVDATMKRDEK